MLFKTSFETKNLVHTAICGARGLRSSRKLMKQPGVHSPTGLLLSPRHQFPDLSRTQSGIAAAAGHTHNHHG